MVNEENDQENSLDDTIPQNYLKCCIPLASQFRSDLRSLSNNNNDINNNKSLVRKRKLDVLINEKEKIVSVSGRKSNQANINCVTVTATS